MKVKVKGGCGRTYIPRVRAARLVRRKVGFMVVERGNGCYGKRLTGWSGSGENGSKV